MITAILFGGGLFYVFTCVLAHRFFYAIGWTNAAESPLILIWPVVLLFWLLLGWPVMFFMWVTKKSARTVRWYGRSKSREVR